MKTIDLPDIHVPDDMPQEEMPDLLRYWYLGSKARHHMMLRRFAEVDVEVPEGGVSHLDIGSAWGYNVLALSKLGFQATGMDLVIDQFGARKRIAQANDLSFNVVGADAARLPFADDSFSSISMVETLEHVFEGDRDRVFAECRRVLTRSGRLILSTPNHGSFVERAKRVVVPISVATAASPDHVLPDRRDHPGRLSPLPLPPAMVRREDRQAVGSKRL